MNENNIQWPDGMTPAAARDKNNDLEGLMQIMIKMVSEVAPFAAQVEHFADAVYETLGIGDAEICRVVNLIRVTSKLN